MRSKGSRFTGGLGVEGVFPRRRATVRNRSKPLATVRNRPREVATVWPCLWWVLQNFGGFKRRVALFRVAGVALRDIQTCLVTCRKSFVCGTGAIILRRFQKMRCSFHGMRSTLDVSIFILRGRRNTLDVSCGVIFANRIVKAASSGGKVQIPWQAWHLWDVMTIDESLARNIDFEVANLKVHKKTSILKLQSMKIGGSLARHARFDAPQDELQFSWQAQHFGDLHPHFAWQARHIRRVALRALHSALYTPHSTLHPLHFTLRTLHSTLCTTLYTLHFTLHTLRSTFHTPHFTLYTLHSILYIPHFTLYTLHLAHHPLQYSTFYGALVC